jgi:FxsC-like protein
MDDALPRVIHGIATVAPGIDAENLLDALWLAATRQPATGPDATTPADPPRPPRRPTTADQRPTDPATETATRAYPDPLEYAPSVDTVSTGRLRTARGRALPDALDLARSLRPFKRAWRRGSRGDLDIDATAAAYARTGVLTPMFATAEERWFDVAVVVDRTPEMDLWNETIEAFTDILRQLGAFRGVRLWQLTVTGDELRLHDPLRARSVSTNVLRTPNARRLIVVVSDSRAPHWRTRPLRTLLHDWSASTPTVLVNPLPRRLWRYAALGLPGIHVGPGPIGAPNSRLNSRDHLPFEFIDRLDDGTARRLIPLPVVGLAPGPIGGWANTLMRADPTGTGAVLLAPATPADDLDDDHAGTRRRTEPDPAAIVAALRRFASPAAVRLAVLSSQYARTTLPVVHLIRQSMVPDATLGDVAELLVSGVFDALELASGALVHRAGVRDLLGTLLAKSDAWRTHELLTRHITAAIGADTASPTGTRGSRSLPEQLAPFADASSDTLRLLGIMPDDPGARPWYDRTNRIAAAPRSAPPGDRPARTTIELQVFVHDDRPGEREPAATLLAGADVTDFGGARPVELRFTDLDVLRAYPELASILIRTGGVHVLIGRSAPADATEVIARRYPQAGDEPHVIPLGSEDVDTDAGLRETIRRLTALARSRPSANRTLSPPAWRVRDALAGHRDSQPLMPYDVYERLATRHGLPLDAAHGLIRTLADIGEVIHLGGTTDRDAVVLAPRRLIGAIVTILDDDRLHRSAGILDHAWLDDVAAPGYDLPDAAGPYLLRIMEQAGLSYRLPGGDHSLVPAALPADRPALPWDSGPVPSWATVTVVHLRFGRPRADVIHALISRHATGPAVTAWATGMFLTDTETHRRSEAFIEVRDDGEIVVEVRDDGSDTLLGTILDSIRDVIRRYFPTLTYETTRRSVTPPTDPTATRPDSDAPDESPVPQRRHYFYLSHARTSPATAGDYWVQKFFNDLRDSVRSQADIDTPLSIGFYEPGRTQPDQLEHLSATLGGAETFVVLCSEDYRNGTLPMAELTAFRSRTAALGASGHLIPVLWAPTSPQTIAELGDPFDWAGDMPDYRRYGVQTLCRIVSYQRSYAQLVDQLARHIVTLAETSPLGPTRVRIDPVPVEVDQSFTIAVVAPTDDNAPDRDTGAGYGSTRDKWRPFGGTVVAAERAMSAAERLGLPARADGEDGSLPKGPGIVLIDPWILATPTGEAVLESVITGVQTWTATLVVVNRLDPSYAERGAELVARVSERLRQGRIAFKVAGEVDEFTQLISSTVSDAWTRYLRWGPVYPPGTQHGPVASRGRF